MLKAVDLYAGIGGWSLGLGLAGIKVVASYEWWGDANATNQRNNGHAAHKVDIRSLDPSSVPKVDIVVGSPPCTQFSLANRGGRGNVLEGLKDVEKFLEVVQAVKPRFWALENVPRLAEIFNREINQGGTLHRFAGLNPVVSVVDASEWGVPQRRKRAIIGNFNLELLLSYRASAPVRTLGEVVSLLSLDEPLDPVWGLSFPAGQMTEHVMEEPLSPEEERLNRDAKAHHPIYNGMSFPDDPMRPSRTVTATCTRVSRESIVVSDEGRFRRLSLRERASLQSFPLGYQFYAATHPLKQKMVGNAIPPLLTYHIAHSMIGTPASSVPSPEEAISSFVPPKDPPPPTRPDRSGRSYPHDRRFRAAIPGFRFKSGMRFELSNHFVGDRPSWRVRFFFGSSKSAREVELDALLMSKLEKIEGARSSVARGLNAIVESGGIVDSVSSPRLQRVWSHRKEEFAHPYDLVDAIGRAADLLDQRESGCPEAVVSALMGSIGNPPGHKKVLRNSRRVFACMIVGSLVNEMLSESEAYRPGLEASLGGVDGG